MRLLVLSLNYLPEPTGFAPHAAALAEHFAGRGHEVTVMTGFPFAPTWKRWPAYRRMFSSREVVNKVIVRRITHFIPRRAGAFAQRVAMEASFSVVAAMLLLPTFFRRQSRPDVVLYVGAQPAVAMLARLIGAILRVPYFVNINDLATQAAADVGIIDRSWVRRVLDRFEFAAYLPASGASVLCSSFAEALVAHGYPRDRIRLIRSPVDLQLTRPVPFRPEYRESLGVAADAFVVLVAGSMGLKQGLTNVVNAAVELRARRVDSRPITWVLVGDGEMYGEIGRLIHQLDLTDRVRLLPARPQSDMTEMFAAADVLLLNQLGSVKDSVIPSKLLSYMAAGRPVLAAVNRLSQGAQILQEADGGLLVAPEDPAALVRGAEALMNIAMSVRSAMGARNRLYAERHFDQRKVLAEHEAFMVERLAATPQSVAPA